MDTSVDSSPLKRFFAFWMGLGTFCAFGALSYCAYKVTGGEDDPEYVAASKQRSQYREGAEKAQRIMKFFSLNFLLLFMLIYI